jgi:hypothetical protein
VHLPDPLDVVLDRVLDGVLICWSPAYSVVVLPDPVGPVTRMMPWGRRMREWNRW